MRTEEVFALGVTIGWISAHCFWVLRSILAAWRRAWAEDRIKFLADAGIDETTDAASESDTPQVHCVPTNAVWGPNGVRQ